MMPMSVIPIWTVERNLPGLSARARAQRAPVDPRSAAILSRAGRAETIASSDMENRPFSRISPAIMRTSDQGKGVTQAALADMARGANPSFTLGSGWLIHFRAISGPPDQQKGHLP